MKNLVILIVLASCFSCAKDNIENVRADNIGPLITARTTCDVTESTRLRVNEDYTIIVTHCYVNGTLTDVDYEIDNSEPGDKFGMLDLSGLNSTVRVELLNNAINSLSSTPIISNSYSSVSAGDTEYSCECNNSQATSNDCIKRAYTTLKYCDSVNGGCDACSVVVG